MFNKSEPWYIHAGLYAVIVILVFLLIKVAIIDPTEVTAREKYYKSESRIRMNNLRQAEILWEKKHGQFTGSIDSLVNFIKTDSTVIAAITGMDTITERSTNPFKILTHGEFTADSLFKTPKSYTAYLLEIDSETEYDTVLNARGKLVKIDTNIIAGTRYHIQCPDGYGEIGDLFNDALKNTASWE